MGFVENFERRLESLVNGAFSKAFKSQLQPVEISAAIKAKMDVSAAVIGKDRILAYAYSKRAPIAPERQAAASAPVDAMTRAVNVEAFMPCSAAETK